MVRRVRAHFVCTGRPLWGLLCLVTLASAAFAQHDIAELRSDVSTYRQVRIFDFNEKRLGNFDDTPMFWERFEGDGLPWFSRGRFDDTVGYNAPPSFQFEVRGGSVGYEYTHSDLAISPESDFLIEAHVCTENLEHARAFVLCYLLDNASAPIPGSEQVSETVTGTSDWQRVAIELRGQEPRACALRIQLWVLQDYVWQEPPPNVDPIVRQDVDGRAWFDDISVQRMPRVRLELSNPSGLVTPDSDDHLLLGAHNATLADLRLVLTISDADQTELFREETILQPADTHSNEHPIPNLPSGVYTARAVLSSDEELLLDRSIRFAILPEIDASLGRFDDVGVDIGRWMSRDHTGIAELLRELQCSAVKIGIEAQIPSNEASANAYLQSVHGLARELVVQTIETTAVLLPPEAGLADTTFDVVVNDPYWDQIMGPSIALLAELLFSWQLGDEVIESRQPDAWDAAAVERVQDTLERFVAIPAVVVPRSILDTEPTEILPALMQGNEEKSEAATASTHVADQETAESERPPHAYSYLIPASIPPRALPWQLAFWLDDVAVNDDTAAANDGEGVADTPAARWLTIETSSDPVLSRAARIADMAQRFILAKAIAPERVYLPAPFELRTSGGTAAWHPTDHLIPMRTLFRYLSGRQALAALALDPDVVAILFSSPESSALAAWTWRPAGDDVNVRLYVGEAARVVHLSGDSYPLQHEGLATNVSLSSTPIIIENVDAALLLMQHSYRVEPCVIQLHDPEPRPVLRLRNHYPVPVTGTIELSPPGNWLIAPEKMEIQLAPGELLERTLYFTIPPRQIASEQVLDVKVQLHEPKRVTLHFDATLQIELRDIAVKSHAWWDGDDLVVEHTLENRSMSSVSFTAFCQLPGRAQQEGAFLDVPPGAAESQWYVFDNAADARGGRLWTGIQEIDGLRMLDQLVAIPY